MSADGYDTVSLVDRAKIGKRYSNRR